MKKGKFLIKDLILLPKKMYYMFFKSHAMITCEEAAQRLYEYLDGELSTDDYDKIKLHLELCRNCCQRFEFEEILHTIIRDKAKSDKLPSSLKDRILKEIEVIK